MLPLAMKRSLTSHLGYDPDNYCLPVHSALCDLAGQLLLVACYEFAGQMGADVDLR